MSPVRSQSPAPIPFPRPLRGFLDLHHKTGNRLFSRYQHLMGEARRHVCHVACLQFLARAALNGIAANLSWPDRPCTDHTVPPVTSVAVPASTKNRSAKF